VHTTNIRHTIKMVKVIEKMRMLSRVKQTHSKIIDRNKEPLRDKILIRVFRKNTEIPTSKLASFFLNGVSLILVLIRMKFYSVGEEARGALVPRSTTAYCPAL
jgi:hypothetical protein